VPLRVSQMDHAKVDAARALATAIGHECGTAPDACPHRVFDDPLIASVLDAYRMARSGGNTNLAAYAATNPPELLFRAVSAYDRAVDRALAARRRREDARRANNAASQRAMHPRGKR